MRQFSLNMVLNQESNSIGMSVASNPY